MRALRVGLLVVATVAAGLAALIGPELIVGYLYPTLSPPPRIAAASGFRLHILYMLGGVIAIVTLVYAHHRHRRESAQLTLEKQRETNERFGSAVEQLASPTASVRMGGILALQRIANESPASRPAIWRLLGAVIRDHVDRSRPIEADLQTAFEVIGTVPISDVDQLILTDVGLRALSLRGSNLTSLRLESATLAEAVVLTSRWHHPQMVGCDLSDARFETLVGPSVELSDVRGATILVADSARFVGCDLTGTTILIETSDDSIEDARLLIAECVVDGLRVSSYPRRFRRARLEIRNSAWVDALEPLIEVAGAGVRQHVSGPAESQLRDYVANVVSAANGTSADVKPLDSYISR